MPTHFFSLLRTIHILHTHTWINDHSCYRMNVITLFTFNMHIPHKHRFRCAFALNLTYIMWMFTFVSFCWLNSNSWSRPFTFHYLDQEPDFPFLWTHFILTYQLVIKNSFHTTKKICVLWTTREARLVYNVCYTQSMYSIFKKMHFNEFKC